MTKSLDRMTKSELLAHIASQDATIKEQSSRLCAAVGSYRALRDERDALQVRFTALESRRKFETIAYRKKIRTASSRAPSDRMDWAAVSREYCELHGVKSVSKADLEAFASSRRS